MSVYKIISISEKPELQNTAAEWFHSKWEVPVEAYQESIAESFGDEMTIPNWYLCMDEDKIIGGSRCDRK